ncbi:hypothetical protein V2J09_021952 [Rumex salicifolius]
MSKPIHVDIISDDDDDDGHGRTFASPVSRHPKISSPNPTIVIVDDDPTPQKSKAFTSTPSYVAETPYSQLLKRDEVVNCVAGISRNPISATSNYPDINFADKGFSGLICLESDSEGEDLGSKNNTSIDLSDHSSPLCYGSEDPVYTYNELYSQPISLDDVGPSNDMNHEEENFAAEEDLNVPAQIGKRAKRKKADEDAGKKTMTKEERMRSMEEKKQKKEQDKLQKAALKAEAAELKKLEKERQRWEKGKLALKSIVAQIDTKVVESGTVGGRLLTRFSEKDLDYRITSNPIERSIMWTLTMPEEIAQISSKGQDISYILLVYEAEEFCRLVNNGSLRDCISAIRRLYPSYTICFLTNKLMSYINKRPSIEELFAELITHYDKVHSRLCADEAELAEHVVGLTISLATCQFRKRLTWLSVSANGSIVPKDCPDKNLIKQSPWLKALVAIPKVQPRFAIAIWKKYPTMKSLLTIYMDPTKSVHEKEILLTDLMTEGLVGGDRRLGQICSKRVYRILMAQSGNINTEDVENGADFFKE